MSITRLLLASVLGVIAMAALLPAARVSAAAQPTVTTTVHANAAQSGLDALLPAKTAPAYRTDFFPFRSCFTFFRFCSSFNSFNFGFNRFSNCFGFFSFGCNSSNSFNRFPFFPFFNHFNSVFNNASCIRIMRMPGGGTVTVSVC